MRTRQTCFWRGRVDAGTRFRAYEPEFAVCGERVISRGSKRIRRIGDQGLVAVTRAYTSNVFSTW